MKKLIVFLAVLLVQPIVTIQSEGLDESFWGKTISSQMLEIDNFYLHKMTNDRLVLQIGDPYDSTSVIKILDANTLDEIFTITGLHHFFRLSYGANPCILAYKLGYETIAGVDVYDLNGEKLFHRGGPYFIPSPNGTFFYTHSDGIMNTPSFIVLDRHGKSIYSDSRNLSLSTSSELIAISDTLFALFGHQITFINPFNGEEISPFFELDKIPEDDLILDGIGYMRIRNSALNINFTIRIPRESEYDSELNSDSSFLASCSRVVGKIGVFQVELIEVKENKLVWAEEIEESGTFHFSPYQTVEFKGNIVTLKSSTQMKYFSKGSIDSNTFTYVYKIDPKTGELLEKTKEPGILDIVELSDGSRRVFHVTSVDSGKVMTVYDLEFDDKVENKTKMDPRLREDDIK